MSFTRFSSDTARIQKSLEQTTSAGRYMLDKPGPGMQLGFFEDPQIRMQGWGANLCENYVNLESDMLGLTRKTNRDLVDINDHKKNAVIAPPMTWGTVNPIIDDSRASCPAWMFRDVENDRWETPFFNPQNNIERPFNFDIQTRILEKDNFKVVYPTVR